MYCTFVSIPSFNVGSAAARSSHTTVKHKKANLPLSCSFSCLFSCVFSSSTTERYKKTQWVKNCTRWFKLDQHLFKIWMPRLHNYENIRNISFCLVVFCGPNSCRRRVHFSLFNHFYHWLSGLFFHCWEITKKTQCTKNCKCWCKLDPHLFKICKLRLQDYATQGTHHIKQNYLFPFPSLFPPFLLPLL